jgi:hypothetical protein
MISPNLCSRLKFDENACRLTEFLSVRKAFTPFLSLVHWLISMELADVPAQVKERRQTLAP